MTDNLKQGARGRIVSALDAMPAVVWVAAGAVLLLGITGLFGGLSTAEKESLELPVVAVGEEHAGPQFSVAVHDLQLMDVAPGYSFEADEGNEYLVVTLTLTNNYVVSTTSITDAIALEWLDDEHSKADRTVLLSDSTTLAQAHPDLPFDVAIVWQVPRGSIADEEVVQVSIMEASLRTDSDLTYGEYWYDPVAVAHVELPAHRIATVGDAE